MQTNTQHNTKTRQDNTSNIDHDTRHEHRLTQMLNTKLTSTIQIQTNAKYDGGHGVSANGRCGGRPIPLRGVALWNGLSASRTIYCLTSASVATVIGTPVSFAKPCALVRSQLREPAADGPRCWEKLELLTFQIYQHGSRLQLSSPEAVLHRLLL